MYLGCNPTGSDEEEDLICPYDKPDSHSPVKVVRPKPGAVFHVGEQCTVEVAIDTSEFSVSEMNIFLTPDMGITLIEPFDGSLDPEDSIHVFTIKESYTIYQDGDFVDVSVVSDSCLIKMEPYDGGGGTFASDYTNCFFSIQPTQ